MTVLLHAAGSLRDALTDIAEAFAASGITVQAKYGPSGTLRERSRPAQRPSYDRVRDALGRTHEWRLGARLRASATRYGGNPGPVSW